MMTQDIILFGVLKKPESIPNNTFLGGHYWQHNNTNNKGVSHSAKSIYTEKNKILETYERWITQRSCNF